MNKNKKNSKKNSSKKKNKHEISIRNKISYYFILIERTTNIIQRYKTLDILTSGQLNNSIQKLEEIYNDLMCILDIFNSKSKNVNYDEITDKLQIINNELCILFRNHGTYDISDILKIQFGVSYYDTLQSSKKFDILKKYTHPIHFKVLNWKSDKINKQKLPKNKIVEDFMIVDTGKTLDCFDLARSSNVFQIKVSGIKICFQNKEQKKTIIMSCITDDIVIQCTNNEYIKKILDDLYSKKPNDDFFQTNDFNTFLSSLSLKELMIYNNTEIYHKFNGFINQNLLIKQKPISDIVKEFLSYDLYKQRYTLIQLLIKYKNPEYQYLAYLLYDLLSNENNGVIDTQEQTILFDSLPWNIKRFFKEAMKNTMNYTKEISDFETNKIPLEQQICLLKANNTVKEKAMIKLKEVKAKSEDSGSKARQYLEGLLKIPFGIFRKEKLLTYMDNISVLFHKIIDDVKLLDQTNSIQIKEKYTNLEIFNYSKYFKNELLDNIKNKERTNLISCYIENKRDILVSNICYINSILKKYGIKKHKLCHSGKKVEYMKKNIKKTIIEFENNKEIYHHIQNKYNNTKINISTSFRDNLTSIDNEWKKINIAVDSISKTLDESVHGHKNAKRQIERIIGQWITGKQTGYCFGFEGPPGVGKTSLARKGLAYCLKDTNGESRPFSFIAVGGASNGSTIAGHNYTYVGSTWGKIVDILIESKCMNPIIFIDELDKISKTENGKEIIGILTHLIDTTQNEQFQDKYFSGIDLDLSKALFIFSYNDVSSIDRILLDRIHRIKFDNLTLNDKLEIVNKYILPEYFEKFNISNVKLSDEVIKYIIEKYTLESGVRKLKELIFEIISEINLEILKQETELPIPFHVTIDLIKNKYLKKRKEVRYKKKHTESSVGIISGLWANSLGMGGIIPIEASFYPSSTFLEFKLTGLQGDVMKESMNVSKTLSWSLTNTETQKKLTKQFEDTKMQGIHIHCPEGAVPKDGPSAGTAITICIYSLLNSKKIKNNIAITGEINLQGRVTEIGGLDLKILGGIRAGIDTFIYPKSNSDDFNKFMEEQKDKSIFENISFINVETIQEVLDIVFEE
ncbi:MAG: AAA family ATPase [Pelagibacteraceae bacterium TMED124]|nr:MAG: AAA family ATPase [Pelagibacteraceae bacterium TMED124]